MNWTELSRRLGGYAEATMNRDEIVQSLRAEIAHLQKILDLMEEIPGKAPQRRGPGRPESATKSVAALEPKAATPQKRVMSPEGKARIAAAQKSRWARVKRASSTGQLASKTRKGARGGNNSAAQGPSKKAAVRVNKASSPAAKKTSGKAVKRPTKAVVADQTSATE